VFRTLDQITKPDAILASNTSSISITKLGAATKRPDKVIGMHFMNPVPVMKLVEVIRGAATSEATYGKVRELTEKLGKTPLECQDYPGFVSKPRLNADD
jgi:3-hydroxybutyryl-CoA dehydrogenase